MQRAPEGIRMHQIRFAPGLRPGPHWGAHNAPRPLSWMGGISPPHAYPPPRRLRRLDLGAFGACLFAPNLFFVPARLKKYSKTSLRCISVDLNIKYVTCP